MEGDQEAGTDPARGHGQCLLKRMKHEEYVQRHQRTEAAGIGALPVIHFRRYSRCDERQELESCRIPGLLQGPRNCSLSVPARSR